MKKIFIILTIMICLILSIEQVSALEITNLVNILDGSDVIGGELQAWIDNALKFTQYAGIALAIVLTAMDFIKAVGGSKDDDLKNAFGRTIKRVIALILLLLTTVIVDFAMDIYDSVNNPQINPPKRPNDNGQVDVIK